MARGAGWRQQPSIDFSLYLKATASLLSNIILRVRRRRVTEEEDPNDASSNRKVLVGKLACHVVIVI